MQAHAQPEGAVAPNQRAALPGWQVAVALGVLLLLVTLTYSNHFRNSFHFDDSYSLVSNPYVRDLHNIQLFFRDVRTNDALPTNQTYRPLLMASFAVDYWLGRGLNPLWFHISTFVWYLAQLVLMFFLYRKVLDSARADPRNAWVAWFATALFGLHPAMAETVNYIMQRADLYSTLAVICGLAMYIFAPGSRRFGAYLIPVVVGLFAKQPTAVFPALLLAWVWLFEEERLSAAIARCVPAFVVTGAAAFLVLKMNAATFAGGAPSAYDYRISQPAVLLSYFRRLFLPLDLSADTDRRPYASIFDLNAIYGFLFIVLVCAVILWCRRRRETRPISFGLIWFLVACIPTSWIPLAEVENDHRLFFPFVGLVLSVCWAAALWLYDRPIPRPAIMCAGALILGSAAWGAHQRNIVWHTDESLWLDVTRKSPTNGRGLMNYGLSQMGQGRLAVALDYFTRALVFNPYYPTLEINLGVVNGALHHGPEAERHFLRAIQLAPESADARMFYARWLVEVGRIQDALANLNTAVGLKPDDIEVRYLLMQIYGRSGDLERLRIQAEETLKIYPTDATALAWLAKAAAAPLPADSVAKARTAPADFGAPSAQQYLNESQALCKAGRFAEAIASARKALEIKPNYAEAWNNIMVACNSLADWDLAIAAGEKAVSLDPGNRLAQNNLAWAKAQKLKAAALHP